MFFQLICWKGEGPVVLGSSRNLWLMGSVVFIHRQVSLVGEEQEWNSPQQDASGTRGQGTRGDISAPGLPLAQGMQG